MACLFALALGAGAAGAAGPARAYEMVSPVEKENASVRQDRPGEFAFQTWPGGNSVVYTTQSPFPGADGAPLYAMVMAKRSPSGWSSTPLDPPSLNPLPGAITLQATFAVSEDQTHAFVYSQRKLTPQATEYQGNYYIKDLETGGYEFVGSSPEALTLNLEASEFYLGGTADFSAVEFTVPYKMTPESAGASNTYLWSRSQGLQLISILPDGTPAAGLSGVTTALPQGRNQLSADGTRAYFSLSNPGQHIPGTEGVFLYENGHTRSISTVHIPGEPETVKPAEFLSATPDGSRVMFRARDQVLTPGAPPNSEANIYIADVETNTLELVATHNVSLATEDLSTIVTTNELGELGASESGLSPNGRYLAFASTLRLTNYDNTAGPACEFGCAEIYVMDTADRAISCASCRGDGQPPTGSAELALQGGQAIVSRHRANVVTNGGQVFFSTPDPLVAEDSNGLKDVYEYDGGSQRLISSGSGSAPSTFVEASPDGSDVFFITTQRLVSQDKDDNADLYDARVGGGIPGQNQVPESEGCELELCGPLTVTPAAPIVGSKVVAPEAGHKPAKHKSKHHKKKHHKGKARRADAHAGVKGRKGR